MNLNNKSRIQNNEELFDITAEAGKARDKKDSRFYSQVKRSKKTTQVKA